jgi:hypothetical protein
MMFLFLLPLLSACGTMSMNGDVVDGTGKPIEGALVSATDTQCSTTTDGSGKFILECEPGVLNLTFSKPSHIGVQTRVEAPEKLPYPIPTQTLTRIPEVPGLFVLDNGRYIPVVMGTLERTMQTSGNTLRRAYCLQDGALQPTKMKKGEIALFDNQAPSWRLFRLDADRCAYRDTRNAQGRWVVSFRDKPAVEDQILGGEFSLHKARLEPGHYFAAHWKGFFSPTAPDTSLYGGFWIQVED